MTSVLEQLSNKRLGILQRAYHIGIEPGNTKGYTDFLDASAAWASIETGTSDDITFVASDLAQMRAWLDCKGVKCFERMVPDLERHQILV